MLSHNYTIYILNTWRVFTFPLYVVCWTHDGCAHESNKLWAPHVTAGEQTCLHMSADTRLCVSRSHKFTQLGNYVLQMAECHQGKILLQRWPPFESPLSECCIPDLTRHHQPHQSFTFTSCPRRRAWIHNDERNLRASEVRTSNRRLVLGSQPLSVYFKRCKSWACFLKEQKILVVFTLEHVPLLNISPQINIKVCLQEEMLGKYILKPSVISLSCHQLDDFLTVVFLQISPCDLRETSSDFMWFSESFQSHNQLQRTKMLSASYRSVPAGIVLTWCRFNGNRFVIRVPAGPNKDQFHWLASSEPPSWEKFTFSTQQRMSKKIDFLKPSRRVTVICVTRWAFYLFIKSQKPLKHRVVCGCLNIICRSLSHMTLI